MTHVTPPPFDPPLSEINGRCSLKSEASVEMQDSPCTHLGTALPPTDPVMPHADDYLTNYLAKTARASPHFFLAWGYRQGVRHI